MCLGGVFTFLPRALSRRPCECKRGLIITYIIVLLQSMVTSLCRDTIARNKKHGLEIERHH
jgi:hypothetical protein